MRKGGHYLITNANSFHWLQAPQNQTHKIVHSSAMYFQNLIIIYECIKKLLKMKNSKSFLTPSTINAVPFYYLWYIVL